MRSKLGRRFDQGKNRVDWAQKNYSQGSLPVYEEDSLKTFASNTDAAKLFQRSRLVRDHTKINDRGKMIFWKIMIPQFSVPSDQLIK